MDEQWFSASMRIVCLIEHGGATSQDECVHIFRADGWDGVFGERSNSAAPMRGTTSMATANECAGVWTG